MFGTPQDIIAILAGATLIFGGGGAALRAQFGTSDDTLPAAEPELVQGSEVDTTPR